MNKNICDIGDKSSVLGQLFHPDVVINQNTFMGKVHSISSLIHYLTHSNVGIEIVSKPISSKRLERAEKRKFGSVPNYWAIIAKVVFDYVKRNTHVQEVLKQTNDNKILFIETIYDGDKVSLQYIKNDMKKYTNIITQARKFCLDGSINNEETLASAVKKYQETDSLFEGLKDIL